MRERMTENIEILRKLAEQKETYYAMLKEEGLLDEPPGEK